MARVEVKTKNPHIHVIVENGNNKDVVSMVKELYGFIAFHNEAKPSDIDMKKLTDTVNVPTGPRINMSKETEELFRESMEISKDPITVPGMRERLPNNIVDPKELDFTEAVKKEALVRCPHCGQCHTLVVRSKGYLYAMRMNYDTKNFEIYTSFPESEEKEAHALNNLTMDGNVEYYLSQVNNNRAKVPFAYWKNVREITPNTMDTDFIADNNTEIFCPVCGKSDTFGEWKNCYENPLNYFEYENICDACGGEMSMIQKKGESGVHTCERCGWIRKEDKEDVPKKIGG